MKDQPKIAVGIIERQSEIFGRLDGDFYGDGCGPLSGVFSARGDTGTIVLVDENRREWHRAPWIRLTAPRVSTFTLFNVTIGKRFHWERTENQTFRGDLILRLREDGTIAAIDEIFLEDYLTSVISSEMSPTAPTEFLKAHAIISRSWLIAGLGQKKKTKEPYVPAREIGDRTKEVIRWYERESHDLFDVCADDHCQRYQGITKIISQQAEEAVRETRGRVITYRDEVCDARYSKACGGITENFDTAWDDKRVPYLASISDSLVPYRAIGTEEEATRWIFSEPEACCNTRDHTVLESILRDADRETKDFFRWKVEYPRKEMEEILREKSGLDFGTLKAIVPLRRGPSGRIFRLKIVGSNLSVVVGKELEIRRWLSRSHLYSSAFVVEVEAGRVIFRGAGWGHGVGLCQIGAAVMATLGFSAEEILKHYFQGVEVKKIY